ncbi:MAG: S-layer family protein [Leptolyngbyaceae cyanobacterium SL_5_14]|nr:S-layer family protein [Leptolyngbyaceae cyanobacterium SL_5_14]
MSSGSAISATTLDGEGGNITLTPGSNAATPTIALTEQSQISSDTRGRGSAGSIAIQRADAVTLNNSAISTAVRPGAVVTGQRVGNIDIQTRSLSLTNNADITASTAGRGNAGNITITDADTVSLFNSAIATAVEQGASGDGGSISIQTDSLNLSDGAAIAANSDQIGSNAGNIGITASGELQITDSNITTSAVGAAGGAIDITAATVELRGDGDIRTNVSSGAGGGGNITVTADSVLAFDDSDILAFADDGRGGDVTLNTSAFFGENYQPAPEGTDPDTLDGNDRVDINASGAVAGVISVPDLSFIQNSLSELPQVPIDPDELLANSCIARSDQRGSFIVTGAGGLPSRPGTAMPSPFPTGSVQPIPGESEIDASNESDDEYRWQAGEPIVEPQGVYQLPNGRLVMSRECA